MKDVRTPGATPVYHVTNDHECLPHSADVPARARAFIEERLAGHPMRAHAARAIAEIAADLVELGLYDSYEVSVQLLDDATMTCACVGIPGDYAAEPPELGDLPPDHRWPGLGPARALVLTGHACDDGTWLEFPTSP